MAKNVGVRAILKEEKRLEKERKRQVELANKMLIPVSKKTTEGVIDSVIERVYSENYAMRKRLNGEVEDTSEYDVPGYMRTGNTFALTGTDMSNEEQIKAYSPTLQDVYQRSQFRLICE